MVFTSELFADKLFKFLPVSCKKIFCISLLDFFSTKKVKPLKNQKIFVFL